MKLIPMTEFVLQKGNKKVKPSESTTLNLALIADKCFKYAKFLKQPLKLEMFVPCDEDGNVLGKPNKDDMRFYTHKNLSVQEEYQQAKEKVLFEGFEAWKQGDCYIVKHANTGTPVYLSWNKSKHIEDLFIYDLDIELTETGIKLATEGRS